MKMSSTQFIGAVRPAFSQKRSLDMTLISKRQGVYSSQQAQPGQISHQPRKIKTTEAMYVLYTHKDCKISQKMVHDINEQKLPILIQDVEPLNQLPPWLIGVPTIVNTEDGKISKGTDAVAVLRDLPPLPQATTIDTFGHKGRHSLMDSFDDIPKNTSTYAKPKTVDELMALRNGHQNREHN